MYIQDMINTKIWVSMAVIILLLSACGKELTPEERVKELRLLVGDMKLEAAEEELIVLMKVKPTDAAVLKLGAELFFKKELYDSAVSYARKMTALYPSDLEGYRILRESAKMIDDFKSQLWAVSQIAYIEGDRRKYYFDIAELNFNLGQFGLAIATCNDILEFDPESEKTMFLLSNALASAGNIDSSILVMERLDRKYPDQVQILSNLGSFYANKREYNQAAKHFERIIALYPDYVGGWFGLGNVKILMGDTTGALEAYRQVYMREPAFLGVDSILRELDPFSY